MLMRLVKERNPNAKRPRYESEAGQTLYLGPEHRGTLLDPPPEVIEVTIVPKLTHREARRRALAAFLDAALDAIDHVDEEYPL